MKKLTTDDQHQSRSLAARGFLHLLLRLSRIVLQDSAFLRQVHPNHFLLRHPVFNSPAYDKFAARMLEVTAAAESPIILGLKNAMPHMVTEMTNLRGALTTDFKTGGGQLRDE